MVEFFSVIHVLLCLFMIFVILLQPGRDQGMGAALGGGSATSAFGGRGATTFLSKVTAVCAVAYFATSLGLSFVGLRTSVTQSLTANLPAPAAPAAPAPAAEKKESPAAEAPGALVPGVGPGGVTATPADAPPVAPPAPTPEVVGGGAAPQGK